MATNLVKATVMFAVFLFISLDFLPSIQILSVKAAQEQDFVEIRTEMCGVSESSNQTARFTQEQYILLRQYLSEFENRFNSITTREEALLLYKDLAVELAAFDLLPKGMTIQRAQSLMLQGLGKQRTTIPKAASSQKAADSGYNIGCLVSGEVHNALSYFVPVVLPLAAVFFFLGVLYLVRFNIYAFVSGIIDRFFPWPYFPYYYPPLLVVLELLLYKLQAMYYAYLSWSDYNPVAVFNRIRFFDNLGTGRIRTIGLLGVKQWDGTLKGIIPPVNDTVVGFTGCKLAVDGQASFFFTGSALAVGVGYGDT